MGKRMNVLPEFVGNFERLATRYRAVDGKFGFVVRYRWFLIFVVLPVAFSILYFGLIASDQYVSESRFIVKSSEQRGPQMSTLANLIQTTGLSRGQEETNSVLEYIRSRNALSDLSKTVDVRAVYDERDVDRLSRYPRPFYDPDKFENLYDFYRGKVETYLDNETGLAVLNVRAFEPSDARRLNGELLKLSEALVNRLNERAHEQAIGEAERRVVDAQIRVRAARVALAGFRNSQDLIDPEKQAGGIFEVITQLTAQRAALQAQLDQTNRAAPNNPMVPALRQRVAALDKELSGLSSRVVGSGGAIASKMGGYENLLTEQEFATEMLTAASAALEQARTEAQKQQFYLERVVEPNQPDIALYPKRILTILTVAGTALCLYFIGWMLIVGILEHAPED